MLDHAADAVQQHVRIIRGAHLAQGFDGQLLADLVVSAPIAGLLDDPEVAWFLSFEGRLRMRVKDSSPFGNGALRGG
jgi:hypothetical protein